ncbi:hypothetical protein D3248_02750 [Leucobacter zeae]|nr:hypothetical protein [Leucobacter zeae]
MQSSVVRRAPAAALVAAALCAVAGSALAGCSAADQLNGADTGAIAQLARVAPAGAELDAGASAATECWAPSRNLIAASDGGDGDRFRVICRVHYEERGSERYRDVICIGDLAADPVAERCTRWAYYTGTPKFEDRPGYAAA